MRVMRNVPFLVAAALLLAACASNRASKGPREGRYMSFKDVFDILKESRTTYEMGTDSTLSPLDLSLQGNKEATVNPMLYKVRTGKKTASIKGMPEDATWKKILAAEDGFSRKDYPAARARYAEAVAMEPGYFKTYTFIGDCFYNEKEYDSAEVYFKKALSLNPYDYQAHWFLSDAYGHMGRPDSSLKYLIKAWALNRHKKEINIKLQALAEVMGLEIVSGRTLFDFNFDRQNAERVVIKFKDEAAMENVGLANCLACFDFEPACKAQRRPEGFDKAMYVNCLGNQIQALQGQAQAKGVSATNNRRLLDIYKDGFLKSYILWEIGQAFDPHVLFFEDEEEIGKVEAYIRKYVIVKRNPA